MNWEEYYKLFDEVLEGKNTGSPYDNPDYVEYVKLNTSRVNRWLKRGEVSDEMKSVLSKLTEAQEWILICEPWCADAANIAPFLYKLSEQNKNVHLNIQLRDAEPMLINDYLTNGSKSIPKLIVRDKDGNDLFTWGPRPLACQNLVRTDIDAGLDAKERKIKIQKWYNEDAGKEMQAELCRLLRDQMAFA